MVESRDREHSDPVSGDCYPYGDWTPTNPEDKECRSMKQDERQDAGEVDAVEFRLGDSVN